MGRTLVLPDVAQRRERDDGSRQHADGGKRRHRVKPVVKGFPGKSGPLSAGWWLAGVNRQLSGESPLVGGPRFAAGDIGG
jgi:hypothetical protein